MMSEKNCSKKVKNKRMVKEVETIRMYEVGKVFSIGTQKTT